MVEFGRAWILAALVALMDFDVNFSVLPEQKLPFGRVRLPPKPGTTGTDEIKFNTDQEVEVLSAPSETDVAGWWKAYVKVYNAYLYSLHF